MSAREDTPSRLVRSGAKHYMYNDVFCVKVGFLLSYSLGPGCHANDPRCKPTVQSATTAGAVTPGGSTPAWAMYIRVRAIGRTRERATRTRLMQFAREVAAQVPCERPTVQPTVQSATTAGAVTPGGSTPAWAMYIRAIGRTRERATRTRLMQFAREVAARVPCERPTVQPTVQSATTAGAVTPGGWIIGSSSPCGLCTSAP